MHNIVFITFLTLLIGCGNPDITHDVLQSGSRTLANGDAISYTVSQNESSIVLSIAYGRSEHNEAVDFMAMNSLRIASISGGPYEVVESSYHPQNIFDPELVTLYPGQEVRIEYVLEVWDAKQINNELKGKSLSLYGRNYVLFAGQSYVIDFVIDQDIKDGDWQHIQHPGSVSFAIGDIPFSVPQ